MPGRLTSWLWLAWVVALGLLTAGVFRWHLEYFSSPGPQFYRLALILIPGLALGSWIYASLRGRWLWRWELLLFALLIGSACLVYEPRAFLVVSTLFVACSATGRAALRSFGLNIDDTIGRITLGFGAGAGVLITVLAAAGMLGVFYPAIFLALLLVPLGVFWRDARSTLVDLKTLVATWRTQTSMVHPLVGVAVAFGFVAAVCALMLALAPSIAFDPIAIHLPSVQYYAAQHALRPVPEIGYSYYPQGFEMLWTLAYTLAGQPGAQMISALFFPLFLMILVRLGRECGLDSGAAIIAAVIAATMPFLHWSGSVMKNDLATAFFELLALYSFILWRKLGGFRWIAAGAFFLAQALGIKYVALFAAVPLMVLFGYAAWREKNRWRAIALIVGVLFLFSAYWPLRAYILTGNPVAPSRLGLTVPGSAQRPQPAGQRVLQYLETPWTLTFDGRRSFESPLANPAGILLFAFAPLGLLGGRLRPRTMAQTACVIFGAVYLWYWALILVKVRYAIAPFALLALVAAAWMKTFYDSRRDRVGRAARLCVIAVMTYCLVIAIMGLMIVGINGPQLAYFAGGIDKPGYLRAAMQAYGAVEFVAQTGTHGAVLGIESEARAYSADPVSFHAMWCTRNPCTPERVAAAVERMRPEYLIVPENGDVPPEALARIGNPARVYQDAHFGVYHLSKLSK